MTLERGVVLVRGWHGHNTTQMLPFCLPVELVSKWSKDNYGSSKILSEQKATFSGISLPRLVVPQG